MSQTYGDTLLKGLGYATDSVIKPEQEEAFDCIPSVQEPSKNVANAPQNPTESYIDQNTWQLCARFPYQTTLAMLNAIQMPAFAQSDSVTCLPAPQAQCKASQAGMACFSIWSRLISFNRVNLSMYTRIQSVRSLAVVRSTVDYILATNAVGVAMASVI